MSSRHETNWQFPDSQAVGLPEVRARDWVRFWVRCATVTSLAALIGVSIVLWGTK